MEMAQIYNIVSIVTFSIAAMAAVVAVFCWFKFGIWNIIGDLSGRNAKKTIAKMREDNQKVGNAAAIANRGIRNREMLPEIEKADNEIQRVDMETEVLWKETGILNVETERLEASEKKKKIDGFTIIEDIMIIHSQEYI